MKIIFTEKHGKPQLPENGYFFCILKINKNKLNLNKIYFISNLNIEQKMQIFKINIIDTILIKKLIINHY